MKNGSVTPNQRLASLDILRGLDLFALVFLQPVLLHLCGALQCSWLNPLVYQLDHEAWEGFRVWDMVMPLFMFMAGASMPFAFSKYRKQAGGGTKAMYVKVTKRFIILFILGMVVQGNLLGLDPANFRIYTNTLQAIAVGYLFSAIIMWHIPSIRGQLIAVAMLLVAYWIPMQFCGDYTLEGSFAYKIDAMVIGKYRGDLQYTWVWSSLTFVVTVMLGVIAGEIIKESGSQRRKEALMKLIVLGAACLALGYAWSFNMPIIKKIWTSSMALWAGGWSFLLMAFFYFLVDMCGFSKCLNWLKIYGMNSIAAYMIGECVSFRSAVMSVCYGLEPLTGNFFPTIVCFGNFFIVFLILCLMYRAKVFLKV